MLVFPALLVPAAATSEDHVTDTQFDMFATSLGNLLNEIWSDIASDFERSLYWLDHIYNDFLYYLDQIRINTANISLIKTLIDQVEGYQVTTYEIMIEWYDKMNQNLVAQKNLLSTIRDRINYWQETIYNELLNLRIFILERLDSIKSKLDVLITGESGAADDFNNQVSTEATEFDENMEIIQDVTRPTIEDIDLDVDKEIPEGEVVKVGQLLGIFFQNQYIYIVFFVAFTFSLVSYGIFGKR